MEGAVFIRGTKQRDEVGLTTTGEHMRVALVLESSEYDIRLQIIDHDDRQYIGSVLRTPNIHFETIDNEYCDLLCT